ncbi:MAG: glycosyltransferase family 2 protein, partial [Phycisphaerales bacterium]|nr:glycosyltransferase family 2 protein [Phycisphaerales bacterium]
MSTFPRSLEASAALASHVVVVDSGSTDGTLEYCREQGIEPAHRDWTNPTQQKRFAMSLCTDTSWVLLLDSDETIQDDLAESIRSAVSNADELTTGFDLNRVTWLHGRALRHTFQPEWRLRLVRPDAARLESDPSGVHDRVEVNRGRTTRLTGSLRHDSWSDATDMLARGVQWSSKAGAAASKGGRVVHLCMNPALS